MALPVKVKDINTATLPDFKNANCIGPQRRAVDWGQADDDGTFYALGDTKEYVGGVLPEGTLGLKPQAMGVFSLQRVGSPTFSITLKVYKDSGGSPDFNQIVSTSYPVLASSITTSKTGTSPNFTAFLLITPFTPVQTEKYWYVLKASAAGSSSNYIKVFANDKDTAQIDYTGSQAFGGSWANDTDTDSMVGSYIYNDEHYVFLADKTGNKARAYKNAAGDLTTWAEEAAIGARSLSSTSGQKSLFVQNRVKDFLLDAPVCQVVSSGASDIIDFAKFTVISGGGWSSTSIGSLTLTGALVAGVAGVVAIGGGVRNNDTEAVFVYQGPTETIMGAARRRIKLRYYTSGSWNGPYDVVGSTNTPNSTLPGNANHYDLRWAGVDENGDCHIIYSDDTTNTVGYRKFKSNNTFATANNMNSAVALASAAYPVGLPGFSYDGTDWFIHVPYKDSTSNTLKEARCKTTITETSSNWTLTEIWASAPEITGSIPAAIIPDTIQGKKVYAYIVEATSKNLKYTHDAGMNTWQLVQSWRSGQTCGGISGLASGYGVDLAYLEESTSPDEIRYDHL
jgi:hypothetical protein